MLKAIGRNDSELEFQFFPQLAYRNTLNNYQVSIVNYSPYSMKQLLKEQRDNLNAPFLMHIFATVVYAVGELH